MQSITLANEADAPKQPRTSIEGPQNHMIPGKNVQPRKKNP
jgi:hypothetical protein